MGITNRYKYFFLQNLNLQSAVSDKITKHDTILCNKVDTTHHMITNTILK